MNKFIFTPFIMIFALVATIGPLRAADDIGYSWAGKKIEGAFWGIADSDLDGDGVKETMLLGRGEVLIGQMTEGCFEKKSSCSLKHGTLAARIFHIDLDGDGDEEIVLSGSAEDGPRSVGIDYEDGKCGVVFEDNRWSVRVIDGVTKGRVLIGQGWSSSEFFSGHIYELRVEGTRLSPIKKLDLPRGTKLFQFSFLPAAEYPRIAILKRYEHIELREKVGRRFRRVWRSAERFGGSVNYLAASQREALDRETSDIVIFDLPPVVLCEGKKCQVIALQHDMPLKGFVGRRPYVRAARLVIFATDPTLGLVEEFRTVKLPGAVTGYFIDPSAYSGSILSETRPKGRGSRSIDNEGKNGAKRLIILMQDDVGFFHEGTRSQIIVFELKAG